MIDYYTLRCDATSTDTRVSTFLIGASLVEWTVRINSTFWSTGWRTTDIIWYTRANSLTVDFSALAVRTARCWMARILNDRS